MSQNCFWKKLKTMPWARIVLYFHFFDFFPNNRDPLKLMLICIMPYSTILKTKQTYFSRYLKKTTSHFLFPIELMIFFSWIFDMWISLSSFILYNTSLVIFGIITDKQVQQKFHDKILASATGKCVVSTCFFFKFFKERISLS